MSVVKELRLKIRSVPHTAVEPLVSVVTTALSQIYGLKTKEGSTIQCNGKSTLHPSNWSGLCLEGDAVYELLLVPSLAPSGFSQGPAIFPSPKKTSLLITNDQGALLPFS